MADLRWEVRVGDSRDLLRAMPDASVDAIVCDPPYELGFMNKAWDSSGIAYSVPLWTEALRVLKPGGHLLAFGGSRTYHRMACAIEDAGFEIRDSIHWMYGSGFPKSLDVSKAIDKAAGIWRGKAGAPLDGDAKRSFGQSYERTPKGAPATDSAKAWQGWGTGLKPAQEPIVMARKPLDGTVAANVLAHGTGAINVDGCRVGTDTVGWSGAQCGWVSSEDGHCGMVAGEARPVSGRWPANVLLSHAEECGDGCADGCPVAELDRQGGHTKSTAHLVGAGVGYKKGNGPRKVRGHNDSGGASRFFYSAKPSTRERDAGLGHLLTRAGHEVCGRKEGSAGASNPRAGIQTARRNVHPTVKPIAVMRYLVRLITPPGGLVLDPFCGSGTTGCAAVLEGARFVGLELSPEYAEIAQARIAHWTPTQEALWRDHASA